ncbi:hypothetical protein SC09_contig8orf00053 [Bacillus subtilis]|uniref:Uncharacterized protein n=1 Tax=Bacillus subtilis TaxID=1423 RepID=A0A0D1KDU8_BACIU|nr:hypothetical protein SC09_contig8orf00053 [Bacillus subtilis]
MMTSYLKKDSLVKDSNNTHNGKRFYFTKMTSKEITKWKV